MAIRIRQATALGYVTMPNGGVCDLSYENSPYRRGRVQGGGKITPALMAGDSTIVRITLYEY
jgi:hypothetical protein